MRKFVKCIFTFIILIQVTTGKAQPLEIAVNAFTPPYVIMTSTNDFHGFDIEMMLYLCKVMDRECRFTAIPFRQLINSVVAGDYQLALSGLTITPRRAERVRFSIPYLPSVCSFLAKSKLANKEPSRAFLRKQRFGIVEGTIFEDIIRDKGVLNAPVTTYRDSHLLIEALNQDKISMVLLDRPSALYWQYQSNGKFSIVGKLFSCGLGTAIAVNPENLELLEELNRAVSQYYRSDLFEMHKRYYLVGKVTDN